MNMPLNVEFSRASLCPAGHLPHEGGDYAFNSLTANSQTLQGENRRDIWPISPPVGEMSGRTEGGNVEICFLGVRQ